MQPLLRFITARQAADNNASVPSPYGYPTQLRTVMTLSVHNKLPVDIRVSAF